MQINSSSWRRSFPCVALAVVLVPFAARQQPKNCTTTTTGETKKYNRFRLLFLLLEERKIHKVRESQTLERNKAIEWNWIGVVPHFLLYSFLYLSRCECVCVPAPFICRAFIHNSCSIFGCLSRAFVSVSLCVCLVVSDRYSDTSVHSTRLLISLIWKANGMSLCLSHFEGWKNLSTCCCLLKHLLLLAAGKIPKKI